MHVEPVEKPQILAKPSAAADIEMNRAGRRCLGREARCNKGHVLATASQTGREVDGIAFSAAALGVGVENDQCDSQ